MKTLIFLLSLFVTVQANQHATTDDGKRVLLRDDGTWVAESREDGSQADTVSVVFDFRETRWGMSRKQVLSAEHDAPTIDEQGILVFSTTASTMKVKVAYVFVTDRLVRAKYMVDEHHTNKNDFLSDFDRLRNILVKKYGSPVKDNDFWKRDLYKNDPSHWGMAVSVGDYSHFVEWNTPSTSILLALYGDNYKVTLGVEYTSKRLGNLEKEREKEQNQADF